MSLADKVSRETRSRMMKAVKSSETKIELKVRKLLWKKGIRYRKNVKSLLGKPDIAIKKAKLVVFIDSCFWHFCPIHGHMPKSNLEYWTKKLNRNTERDIKINHHYKELGWTVLRFWEHEVNDDVHSVVNQIIESLNLSKRKQPFQ